MADTQLCSETTFLTKAMTIRIIPAMAEGLVSASETPEQIVVYRGLFGLGSVELAEACAALSALGRDGAAATVTAHVRDNKLVRLHL